MNEAAVTDVAVGRFAGLLGVLSRRPLLALALLCLTLWTPGVLTLPPLDRDESRFAQASKQMLESGDFVDIRFGAVPRYKKPVGIYWLQAAATEIAGQGERDRIWTYRLPSLFGAVAAVWLAWWCARAIMGAQEAFLAAALLGTTLLLAAEATIATTDAVLLACVLGAQGVLLRAYRAARANGPPVTTRLALAGWLAIGIGVLVKGPLVLGVVALTALGLALWDREWRWLRATRPLLGLLVVFLIVAPWAIAIALKSHGHFFQQSLGQDFAAKLVGGQESHGAPPGTYLLLSTLTYWPAILFLLPSLGAALRARGEPAIRFLLVWAATWWIVCELVPTKLPQYILPVYPALAMLAAMWLIAPPPASSRWEKALFYAAPVQFLLGLAALAVGPIVLPKLYGDGIVWWLAAPACACAALGAAALIAYLRRANLAAAVFAFAATLAIYPVLTLGMAPHLDRLWVSPRAAEAAARLARPGDPPPALAGYVEPSLVFLLGSETRQTDGRGAADAGAAQGGLALVEESERPAFLAHLAELEADATEFGALDGYNYSRGRPVHIRIYRVDPVREMPPPPAE